MPGGFGGGPWGGLWGFGTSHVVTVSETVPVSDSVTITFPLRVSAAVAPTSFLVKVTFNHDLDPFYAPNFDPTSYSISGLTVLTAVPGPTPNTVFLTTDEQGPLVYTVIVLDALAASGDPLDPLADSAIFVGFPIEPSFFATAQNASRVQLTFSTAMLQNLAYTDPSSYTVLDLNGVNWPVSTVTAVGPTPNRRVLLELATPLGPGGYYVVTIVNPLVQTGFFLQINPPYDMFQLNPAPKPAGITQFAMSISDFSGEVSGGLLGEPLGLVFFSPSLDALAPNSSIQVSEVSVCTRAFDVYTPPGPIDPNPLYTFSSNGPAGGLGGAVLWAPFERLLGAKLNLTLKFGEIFDPTDGPAVAILAEPFDPAYVALLNNSFWTTYNGFGTPFICASNLAPIPPGPITVITLQGPPESYMAESFGGDPWGGQDWG